MRVLVEATGSCYKSPAYEGVPPSGAPVPVIGVAMIVKDGAATISRAIESVRPHVDEIVVYDTGSTDGTLELLDELSGRAGAEIVVECGAWRDDFSWAREQSLRMLSPEVEWWLRLDCDDVIEGGENLRALTAGAGPEVDGFVLVYDYERNAEGLNVKACWRELLRRQDPAEWAWQQPVHEWYGPREGSGIVARLELVPASRLRVVHERTGGWLDSARRNLALLERAVADAGGAPDLWLIVCLASELAGCDRVEEAARWLRRALADPRLQVGSDQRSQVQHRLAVALRGLGDPQAAIDVELAAVEERGAWAENLVELADIFAELGEWSEAERWARRALEVGLPPAVMAVDPLYIEVTPLVVLAQALLAQGRFMDAVPVLGRVAVLEPAHPLLALAATDPRVVEAAS